MISNIIVIFFINDTIYGALPMVNCSIFDIHKLLNIRSIINGKTPQISVI